MGMGLVRFCEGGIRYLIKTNKNECGVVVAWLGAAPAAAPARPPRAK
jgi:hypothetical protein